MLPYHHIPFPPPTGKKSAIPDDASTAPSPARSIPASKPSRSFGWRWRGTRALTLVEVSFASGILAMVVVGVLQGMLQSRRQTEGSIRQATVASLVQGYLEQIKSLKYATDTTNDLLSSPATTPADTATWLASYALPCKDSAQADANIYLAVLPAPTTLPLTSTLPTDISRRVESVDIDNVNSTADNCTMRMWVWVTPLSGGNVLNCKSIVIVYEWTVTDGGRVKTFSDMARCIRSIVPTDG